jgi:hypothetical protein
VLLSDFLHPLDALSERFRHFAASGCRASVLQLLDPAEELLPYDGRVLFEGMEQEGAALIDNVGGVRARYVELMRAHRESLASCAAGRAGASPPTGPTRARAGAPDARRHAGTPGAALTACWTSASSASPNPGSCSGLWPCRRCGCCSRSPRRRRARWPSRRSCSCSGW